MFSVCLPIVLLGVASITGIAMFLHAQNGGDERVVTAAVGATCAIVAGPPVLLHGVIGDAMAAIAIGTVVAALVGPIGIERAKSRAKLNLIGFSIGFVFLVLLLAVSENPNSIAFATDTFMGMARALDVGC